MYHDPSKMNRQYDEDGEKSFQFQSTRGNKLKFVLIQICFFKDVLYNYWHSLNGNEA